MAFTLTFKIQRGDDLRKLTLPSSPAPSFERFSERIALLFKLPSSGATRLRLQYLDEEGDLITLSTSLELEDLFASLARPEGLPLPPPRLLLTAEQPPSQQPRILPAEEAGAKEDQEVLPKRDKGKKRLVSELEELPRDQEAEEEEERQRGYLEYLAELEEGREGKRLQQWTWEKKAATPPDTRHGGGSPLPPPPSRSPSSLRHRPSPLCLFSPSPFLPSLFTSLPPLGSWEGRAEEAAFQRGLSSLEEMGFDDRELNLQLLRRLGDVSSVVDELGRIRAQPAY